MTDWETSACNTGQHTETQSPIMPSTALTLNCLSAGLIIYCYIWCYTIVFCINDKIFKQVISWYSLWPYIYQTLHKSDMQKLCNSLITFSVFSHSSKINITQFSSVWNAKCQFPEWNLSVVWGDSVISFPALTASCKVGKWLCRECILYLDIQACS